MSRCGPRSRDRSSCWCNHSCAHPVPALLDGELGYDANRKREPMRTLDPHTGRAVGGSAGRDRCPNGNRHARLSQTTEGAWKLIAGSRGMLTFKRRPDGGRARPAPHPPAVASNRPTGLGRDLGSEGQPHVPHRPAFGCRPTGIPPLSDPTGAHGCAAFGRRQNWSRRLYCICRPKV